MATLRRAGMARLGGAVGVPTGWVAHAMPAPQKTSLATPKGCGGVSGLCELTLESRNHHALARFSRDVVGLPLLSEERDRVWLAWGARSRLGVWSVGEREFGDRGGRHVHFAFSVDGAGLAEMARRLAASGTAYRGPVEHEGGDRSLYFEDPEGNVVEAWDFFEHGAGAREGVAALT